MLNSSTVLVLNRHWQAIHVKTPAEAFCMIATGAATALDVQGDDTITPVRWDGWLKLPVREHDNAVNTPRGPVRVPTVIVAANYAKVPLCRPRFGARGIWERDGGVPRRSSRADDDRMGDLLRALYRGVERTSVHDPYASTFVQRPFGVEQLRMMLGEPADAVEAPGFLVSGCHEDHIA